MKPTRARNVVEAIMKPKGTTWTLSAERRRSLARKQRQAIIKPTGTTRKQESSQPGYRALLRVRGSWFPVLAFNCPCFFFSVAFYLKALNYKRLLPGCNPMVVATPQAECHWCETSKRWDIVCSSPQLNNNHLRLGVPPHSSIYVLSYGLSNYVLILLST